MATAKTSSVTTRVTTLTLSEVEASYLLGMLDGSPRAFGSIHQRIYLALRTPTGDQS